MTRAYFSDSYRRSFTARVIREEALSDGRHVVVLDQTYFYPTSGGQPTDFGTMAGVRVLDVIDGDEILHVVERPLGVSEVECEIDWERRFDHMQQHAGQHILSACFEKLYSAETVGFHLGDDMVTIDVTLEELSPEIADAVEMAANEIIYRNLPIKVYFIEPAEVDKLPLRKKPVVTENIRIVEVEGEDYSPCGGTHPRSTGEVGLIKIRRWEKKRNNVRVEFLCGKRALLDYRWKNEQINQIANLLSLKDVEVFEGFQRLAQEVKDLRRETGFMQNKLQGYEAQELLDEAPEIKGVRVVSKIFTDRDLGAAKKLSGAIVEKGQALVLFGVKGEKAQVVFGRSEQVNVNVNDLLKEVIGLIGGTGGGNAKSAQGGGTELHNLESLIQSAELIVKNRYLA